jgi:hypothetical protein
MFITEVFPAQELPNKAVTPAPAVEKDASTVKWPSLFLTLISSKGQPFIFEATRRVKISDPTRASIATITEMMHSLSAPASPPGT